MHVHNDMDRRQRVAVVLLLAAVSLYISSPTVADPDLWGHVRFGQDILSDRGIPTVDPYSYLTEHQTWINHEWLSEVTFAAVFNAAGSRGLLALKSLILLGIVGLLYRQLRARAPARWRPSRSSCWWCSSWRWAIAPFAPNCSPSSFFS